MISTQTVDFPRQFSQCDIHLQIPATTDLHPAQTVSSFLLLNRHSPPENLTKESWPPVTDST